MEVILIKDVDKLGYANDIVDVRPGYANNYLIPQGLAKSATASARKILAENLKQQAHKEAKLVGDAEALAAKIAETPAAHLAEALEAKGITVDRKSISLDAVKTIGAYEASVKIYKGISATVHFEVVAEE